jgi:uncharacterized membrane protein YuzA (DUF378 family)
MLSGVVGGVLAAIVAVAFGHAPATIALAYCMTGLLGASLFMVTAVLRPTPGRSMRAGH